MVLITILLIPVYIIWDKGNYFEEASMNQYSLGNLGSSTVSCSSSFLDEDNFEGSWPIGKITSLASIGVLPSGYGLNDACIRYSDTNKWSRSIDKQKFLADFNQNWIGMPHCHIKNFRSKYLNSESKLWSDNSSVGFYKFSCSHHYSNIVVGEGLRWILSIINILWGAIFFVILRNFKFKTGKEFEIYDQETVTVSDFAVQFNITESMYNNFKDKLKRKVRRNELKGQHFHYSFVYEFKIKLIKKIESQISKIRAISK